MSVIEEKVSFKWEATKEPFINPYNGRVSYDYSGEVKKMTKEDLEEIEKTLKRHWGKMMFLFVLNLNWMSC
ncbi:hypothetical protein [Bacillus sp. AFS014408]|nr:hypothetical protein [Bacillus sp. AFS014408]